MSGFTLSKLASEILQPLTAAMILHLLAVAALFLRRRRFAFACGVLGSVWLWFFSAPMAANWVSGSIESCFEPVPVAETERADVIVVLGGGTESALPPREFADLGDAADRVLHAARLYRAGKAPRVIPSGGAMPWSPPGSSSAADMAALLELWEVPAAAIEIEDGSRTTYENCARVAAMLGEDRATQRVLLVTSALHMRRALATCRSAGLDATPAITDIEVVDRGGPPGHRWLPSASALDRSSRALKERAGFFVYRQRGWITDAHIPACR